MAPVRSLLLSAALVLCTLAVYLQVAGFGFVQYDDQTYVAENPHVLAGLTQAGVVWAMTTTFAANWHPLTWLSLMLDAQIGGGARTFHLTNLLLHLANTLLLFHVLISMTGKTGPSAFVAALFGVHPLHVESVAWVAERKDLLSTLFWLLAIAAYVRYVRTASRGSALLVVLAMALGLLSKPMLVTLPAVLLLLDFWPLGRLEAATLPRLVREKTPLLVLSVASAAITLHAQSQGGAMGTLETFPVGARAANAVVACATYLLKMVFPAHLALPYPWDPERLTATRVLLAALVLAGITLASIRARRTRPYLLTGWLFYLVTLLPVLGLVQVGTQSMADRYTYVPLVGPFLIVAWGARDLATHLGGTGRAWSRALACSAGIVIAALAARAHVQVAVWRDSVSLFSNALSATTRNAAAEDGLGLALLERGRADEAIAHYREALRIAPAYLEARYNLAAVLIHVGRAGEAVTLCREAPSRKPDDPRAYACLGAALLDGEDLEGAAAALEEAVRLDPENASARTNLGLLRSKQGRDEEALRHLAEAARLRPGDAGIRVSVGTLLLKRGELEPAAERFEEALRVEPRNASAHRNLAVARARQGRLGEAIVHFEEALRIEPEDEPTRRNLERARALSSGGN